MTEAALNGVSGSVQGICGAAGDLGHHWLYRNPPSIREIGAAPYPVHYGDAEDPEFLTELPIHDANWVISALPDHGVNRTIRSSLREKGYRGSVAIRTQNRDYERELRGLGSTLILHPYSDAADQAVERIAAVSA